MSLSSFQESASNHCWPLTTGFRHSKPFWVANRRQIQSIGRCRDARLCAVAPFENLPRPVCRLVTDTNRHQHPGDVAHHVVQKGVRLHLQNDAVALPANGQFVNDPNRMPGLTFRCAERTEIMFTDQRLTGGMHPFRIQGLMEPGRPCAPQRRAVGAIENLITVPTGQRREPGMKVIGHGPRPGQTDIPWQMRIATQHPGSLQAHCRCLKMRDLTDAMHSSIGTASADQSNGMVSHLGQRLFQRGLHGARSWLLRLPAPES